MRCSCLTGICKVSLEDFRFFIRIPLFFMVYICFWNRKKSPLIYIDLTCMIRYCILLFHLGSLVKRHHERRVNFHEQYRRNIAVMSNTRASLINIMNGLGDFNEPELTLLDLSQ